MSPIFKRITNWGEPNEQLLFVDGKFITRLKWQEAEAKRHPGGTVRKNTFGHTAIYCLDDGIHITQRSMHQDFKTGHYAPGKRAAHV